MTDRGTDSPLVNAVVALHRQLTELERLGGKINSLDMSSDVDVDHVQKLLARFAECGQSISEEVNSLSSHLRDAQLRAESVAQKCLFRPTFSRSTGRATTNIWRGFAFWEKGCVNSTPP